MEHFPTLETERLRLSKLKVADIPTIIQLANNINIAKYTQNLPNPYFEKDAVFWINLAHQSIQNGSKVILAIRNKATDAFMGGMGLHVNSQHHRAELGYWIGEPFWGKGFVTEAVHTMMKYGFNELNLHRIHAHYVKENVGSGRVMEKVGMKREGELLEHQYKYGVYHTIVAYGITKEQFFNS
ncbi:MAG: GNAT family protein [Bacteroidota bacterium]